MRAPHDSFHQASAIESQAIAQVLLYWQKTDDIPSHHLIETPWSGICDKFNNALAVYTRLLNTSINKALSTSSTTNLTNLPSQNHDLIAIRAFVRATLRLSQFLLTVWACEGLNDNSLKALVEGVTPSFLATQPDRDSIIEHADKMPHLARSQISTIAQQAHGTHLFHLNKVEQLRVILTLIHLHDSIGFARKAAYFRQEVVVICADLVEASRNKSLIQSSDSKLIVNQLNDNNELLVKILDNICDVYGIDTQSTYLYVNGEESEATENVQQEVENNFKWISVQRDFLRDAMTVVQHLGDLNAVIKYAVILLKVYHASLPAAEQVRLVQIMLAALEALRRRSTTSVELAFWSPDLLLSLEVIPCTDETLPFATNSQQTVLQKLANTPTRRATRIAKSIAVQDEYVEVSATVHNPYKFTLELQAVELITSGVTFESEKLDVYLAPNSYQTLRLKGVVKSRADEEKRKSKVRSERLEKRSKVKSTGLSSIPSLQRQSMSSRASTVTSMNDTRRATLTSISSGVKAPQYIEVAVVASLPTLIVAGTNLSHHALMLYSGECTTLRLTVENVSDVDVDFINLKFRDNSTDSLLEVIEEQQSKLIDTYDMEYTIAHEPVFKPCVDLSNVTIPARKKATLEIECYGRMGCNQGSIFIEYGSKKINENEQTYARQLTYPLLLTVQQTLEVQQFTALPLERSGMSESREYFGLWPTSPSMMSQPMSPTNQTQMSAPQSPLIEQSQLLQNLDKDANEFLFVVDIRNSFGTPFEVVLERTRDGDNYIVEFGVCRLVQPGLTARLVLPMKRTKLTEEIATAGIPSICERQFIISQASLTPQKERVMRELFWYSQEIYKKVRLYWREPVSTTDRPRVGSLNLNLRKHKLSKRMLNVVKLDALDVELINPTWERLELGREAQLQLKIANRTERTLKLNYQFEVSLDDCLIIKGPKSTHIGPLKPDEEVVKKVNILPISKSHLELRLVVHEEYQDSIIDTTKDWDLKVRNAVGRLEAVNSKPFTMSMSELENIADNDVLSLSWDLVRQALKKEIEKNIEEYYKNTNKDTKNESNTQETVKMELDTRTKTEPDVGASEQNSLLLGHAREQIQTPAVVLPPKRAPVVESISEKEAYEEFSRIWDVLETDFVDEPPFTIQRIAELAVRQRGTYSTVGKYLRALGKTVTVTSGKVTLAAQMKALEDVSAPPAGDTRGHAVPLDSAEMHTPGQQNSTPPTPLFSPIPFLAERASRDVSPLTIQETQVEDLGNPNLHRPTSPTSSSNNAAAAAAAALGGQPSKTKQTGTQEHHGIVDELDAGQGKVAEEPVPLSSTTKLENTPSPEKSNEEDRRAHKRRKSEHLLEIEDQKLAKEFYSQSSGSSGSSSNTDSSSNTSSQSSDSSQSSEASQSSASSQSSQSSESSKSSESSASDKPTPSPSTDSSGNVVTVTDSSGSHNSSGDNSGGLGTGGIIGIAVGVGVVAIAAAGFIIWRCVKRRYSDIEDDEDNSDDIKWPQLRDAGGPSATALQPLPARPTGGAGIEMESSYLNPHPATETDDDLSLVGEPLSNASHSISGLRSNSPGPMYAPYSDYPIPSPAPGAPPGAPPGGPPAHPQYFDPITGMAYYSDEQPGGAYSDHNYTDPFANESQAPSQTPQPPWAPGQNDQPLLNPYGATPSPNPQAQSRPYPSTQPGQYFNMYNGKV
ncbi:hypothetical protein E3Q11_02760 [Wallemia mellicola]|nr:hypothetical protein E3Q11_02760 [Wallemia mellicola]